MKINLITKEDWENASLGVKTFNVIVNVIMLVVGVFSILEILDWIGLIS
jgi:hypothetical protein|tara:strand:+ start:274 stop:420 length:147 start_codon:yes stop_codon:yes gene_type:complete